MTGTSRCGLVALVGRPNVGKSTLANLIVGEKFAIVSQAPQTTRNRLQGVRTLPGGQIVVVDTPGIHKPQHRMNEMMVEEARAALRDVDLIIMVVEATGFGPGDRYVLSQLPREGVEVTIDGDPLPPAAIGIAAPADPGAHRIAAARDGTEVDSREVTLAEGGEDAVTLRVPPLPPRPETDEAAPLRIGTEEGQTDEEDRPSRWWLWTILALAVAGGATAAAVLLLRRDDPLRGNLMPGRISF